MQISVDGGALCANKQNQYGTHRFTIDLLNALSLYDNRNDYTVYTYCDIDKLQTYKALTYKHVRPHRGWMKLHIAREEILNKKDVFLAVNQALPFYTPARKVVVCHGLSFYNYRQYYASDYDRLMNQLRIYTRSADDIIVSSSRVKDDLDRLPFAVAAKIHVLPFGIPFPYQTYENRKREPFFLYVGSDQQIKNISFLIHAFEKFSSRTEFADFKLILIGVKEIDKRNNRIQCIPHLPSDEIRSYYQRACGYLTASFYESFNYPVIEALSQKCPVVARESAIIPEQRPFVSIADSVEDMCHKMACLAKGKSPDININKFEQSFSWKTFVKHLTRIYNE